MQTRILKTEQEYNEACDRIYELIHSTENDILPLRSEGEEIELLWLPVEKYEKENFPIEAHNPIDAIKFRMDQMNLRQEDIAPLFGGKTRVSEILRGKRSITLMMITLLNRYLGIPLESLIAGNKERILDTEKKEKLMSLAAVREYLSKSKPATC